MSNQLQRKDAPAQGQVNAESRNTRTDTSTVVVGSRLPWPYKIELYEMRTERELVMGGGSREVQVARRTGDSFVINGNRVRVGDERRWEIVNSVGITHGIPTEAWEKWLKDHKDEHIIKNRIIFAFAKVEDVKVEAKNVKKTATGLEPYRTDGTDPRKPKPPKGEQVIGELGTGDPNKDE